MAGNANSGRRQEKPFADALRMEIAAAGEDRKALRIVAQKLIAKAQDGDMQAIRELADRTDGKAVQQVEANVNLTHEDALEQFE
jgi:ribosomal protein L17